MKDINMGQKLRKSIRECHKLYQITNNKMKNMLKILPVCLSCAEVNCTLGTPLHYYFH